MSGREKHPWLLNRERGYADAVNEAILFDGDRVEPLANLGIARDVCRPSEVEV
jgi:hypothetical protein